MPKSHNFYGISSETQAKIYDSKKKNQTKSKSWHGRLIKIRYSLSIKICSRQCSDADDDLHVPNHHTINYHQTIGGHTEILGLGRRQLLGKIYIGFTLLYSAVPLNCKMEEIHFTNWRLYALLH